MSVVWGFLCARALALVCLLVLVLVFNAAKTN